MGTTYATKLNSIFSFYNLRFKPSPPQRHNIKMVLEAVMVVVDNSESSRNGDYTPTRYEAQADAVSLIFSAITQANPESSVGLMSMGGKGPEVLVTLTTTTARSWRVYIVRRARFEEAAIWLLVSRSLVSHSSTVKTNPNVNAS